MRLRGADGRGERGDVVWPVVASAVDEERRRAGDSAQVRALEILGDALDPEAHVEVAGEALLIQAEPPRIAEEVGSAVRVDG
jgi:hypothetical protein